MTNPESDKVQLKAAAKIMGRLATMPHKPHVAKPAPLLDGAVKTKPGVRGGASSKKQKPAPSP